MESQLRRPRSTADVLRAVAEETATQTGDDFFHALTAHLATALDLRYCFIAECCGVPPHRSTTLAFWDGTSFAENFEYELAGTPCQHVLHQGEAFVIGHDVQQLFPQDQDLVDLGAESYVAVPILGSGQRIIGHLAALDPRPLDGQEPDLSMLKIFAARVGAELERRRAEAERLTIEQQMLQAQKLESLGFLAGGIAHDFNNLLTGILGNTGLALQELPPGNSVRPLIEEAEHAAERAAELAQQLLDYAGRGTFTVEPLQLGALVEEMVELLRTSISKKATLKLDLSSDLPTVKGDPTQLRQVIMNLLTNASDALEGERGTITVRIGEAEVEEESFHRAYLRPERPAEAYLFLEVKDTGCGMDEATQKKIFDPFFTTKRSGRGLGMASVLGIVRGHHGAIMVESAVERGSTFRLLLPTAGEPAKEAPAEPRVKRLKGSGCILVVDDEELVRLMAQSSLESAGFEVLNAENGRRAVEVFRRRHQKIAGVLLDMMMPDMDGYETFCALQRIQPDVKVVLSSGYGAEEVLRHFGKDDLAGFLKKPYSPTKLCNIVRSILN